MSVLETENKERRKEFLAEMDMMKKIGSHRNIVQMFGYVTKTEPYLMVMELVLSGDLHNYLLKLRSFWDQSKKNITG